MTTLPALQCPVCGRPAEHPGPPACRTCGLPAVGQAAQVVTRIGVTLREIAADRDALLDTLRAATPGRAPRPAPAPAWQPRTSQPPASEPAFQPPVRAPEPVPWMTEPP